MIEYEIQTRAEEMMRLIREVQGDLAKAAAASQQVTLERDRYRRGLEEIDAFAVDRRPPDLLAVMAIEIAGKALSGAKEPPLEYCTINTMTTWRQAETQYAGEELHSSGPCGHRKPCPDHGK